MLLEAPILPTLLRLSLPNVLNLLALAGMITFDGLFLGRLGADALAGVSLVFPFVMFAQHTAASGVGGAVSSSIARALGAGDRARADSLAAHALALAVGMGLLFSLIMLTLGPAIYRGMGGQGAALDAALAYSNAVFAGAIMVWLLNILANVVRGTGNMSLPAQVLVGAVVAHVAISPLLIFGWGPVPALGTAGAGWGLALSFAAGTAVLLVHLRLGKALVSLPFAGVTYRWEEFKDILRVGIPGMANVAINNAAVIVLTAIAVRMGQDAALGYAIGARLEYIIIPLAFGFGTGIVAMIGTNWGAKQFHRARRIAWIGAATVAVACGAVGSFFALFPGLWLALFSANAGAAQAGTLFLQIVGPMYALYGLGFAIYYIMQGTGNVVPAVWVNFMRMTVCAAGAYAAVTWFGAGPAGMFAAIAAGFVLCGTVSLWLLWRLPFPVAPVVKAG